MFIHLLKEHITVSETYLMIQDLTIQFTFPFKTPLKCPHTTGILDITENSSYDTEMEN